MEPLYLLPVLFILLAICLKKTIKDNKSLEIFHLRT